MATPAWRWGATPPDQPKTEPMPIPPSSVSTSSTVTESPRDGEAKVYILSSLACSTGAPLARTATRGMGATMPTPHHLLRSARFRQAEPPGALGTICYDEPQNDEKASQNALLVTVLRRRGLSLRRPSQRTTTFPGSFFPIAHAIPIRRVVTWSKWAQRRSPIWAMWGALSGPR